MIRTSILIGSDPSAALAADLARWASAGGLKLMRTKSEQYIHGVKLAFGRHQERRGPRAPVPRPAHPSALSDFVFCNGFTVRSGFAGRLNRRRLLTM